MNRERKFRGKVLDPIGMTAADWPIGDLVHELSTGKTFIVDLAHFNENTKLTDVMIEVDPETVGQFSGQLDKDNQEMYEGDLVEDVSYHDSIVCELRFENTGFWLKGNNDNVLFMPSQQYRKVVGNIHNNPVKEGI